MFNLTSLSSCNFATLSSWWQFGEVDSTEGAGLDLDPETQGMRVTKAWWNFLKHFEASCSNSLRCPGFFRETTCEVYDKPGQPGLYERDLITKIDEAPLRGETKDQAEQSVSSEFFDANLERTDLLFSWFFMMFRFTDILLIHSLLLQCSTFFWLRHLAVCRSKLSLGRISEMEFFWPSRGSHDRFKNGLHRGQTHAPDSCGSNLNLHDVCLYYWMSSSKIFRYFQRHSKLMNIL